MARPAPKKELIPVDPGMERYTLITWLFDQLFRIPGTKWRFGLDAIIGLVPGAGDLIGSLVGTYGVWVAHRLGAPTSIQARMLWNLAVDGMVGAVPLLGDLFDFAFKAHVRNRVLLEQWLLNPGPTRRQSTLAMLGIVLGLIAIVGGTLWLAVVSLRWLYGLVTS